MKRAFQIFLSKFQGDLPVQNVLVQKKLFSQYLIFSSLQYIFNVRLEMLNRFRVSHLKKFSVIIILFGLVSIVFYTKSNNEQKVDWNDYKQIAYEGTIHGYGEHGEGITLDEPELIGIKKANI